MLIAFIRHRFRILVHLFTILIRISMDKIIYVYFKVNEIFYHGGGATIYEKNKHFNILKLIVYFICKIYMFCENFTHPI